MISLNEDVAESMSNSNIAGVSLRGNPPVYGRTALFLSMLLSGGLLILPRLPILCLMIFLCLLATRFRLPVWSRLARIYVLLAVILIASIIRPGPIHYESIAIRMANFLGALSLLSLYLMAPAGALTRDLFIILKWLSVQAIATVVLARFMGFLFLPITFSDTTVQTILLVFNYHELIEDLGGLIRPDGFFFEPGVFQIYLNLYLYLSVFIYKRASHSALATLAVLSTQSTTGLIICMIILGAAAVAQLRTGNLKRRLLAIALVVLIASPIIYLAYDNINDKLFGELRGSSIAREYDLFTGINIVAENPLFGIGFDHARYLAESGRIGFADTALRSDNTEDRATSNGLLYLTYSMGIPLALLFLFSIFRQKMLPNRLIVGAWLLLSLFGEAIIFTPFILMIILSAFVPVRKPNFRPPKRSPVEINSAKSLG